MQRCVTRQFRSGTTCGFAPQDRPPIWRAIHIGQQEDNTVVRQAAGLLNGR
jgi:hypothetical protein